MFSEPETCRHGLIKRQCYQCRKGCFIPNETFEEPRSFDERELDTFNNIKGQKIDQKFQDGFFNQEEYYDAPDNSPF